MGGLARIEIRAFVNDWDYGSNLTRDWGYANPHTMY